VFAVLFAFGLVLLTRAGLSAQEPLPVPDSMVAPARNTPPPAKPPVPKRDRWKISTEFGLTDQSGNRAFRLFSGGLTIGHLQREAFRLDASARTRYGRSQGVVVSRNHFGSLAFDLHPNHNWSPSFSVDAERDPFKRLAVRVSSGAGVKYVVYKAPRGGDDATISTALRASLRRLTEVPSDTIPRDQVLARWSVQGKGRTSLTSHSTLTFDTHFQPSLNEASDYLLRSVVGIRARMMSKMALSVIYEFERTSMPPRGVEPENRILKTSFIIDF
jgi:hypothetical protein